uniref:F-box domain-containing protein n=1 Tax=Brassica oleracea TaxID=3712 RepID=A0A3P6C0Y1_BRAOL|nr:unnamed protein product [Brassica oleracea]
MALGKKRIVAQRSNLKHRRGVEEGGLGLELELVQYKKVFGRKRILVSDTGDSIFTSPVRKISSKKLCDKAPSASCQSPELEDLHLDILICVNFYRDEILNFKSLDLSFYDLWILLSYSILVRIICRVEHEDLKQLFHVSKTVREATLIAKQSHFAYSTPRKTSVFQHRRFSLDKPFGLGDGDDYEIEAPGAPLQKRYRYRNEDDSGVSVALFK